MIRRYRNLSVQGKLAVIVMMICTVLMVLMTIFFVIDKVFSYRRSMVENHTMLIETIAKGSTAPLVFDDRAAAEETLATLSAVRDVVTVTIYTGDGTVFAQYLNDNLMGNSTGEFGEQPFLPGDDGEKVEFAYNFTKQYLDLVAPIFFEKEYIGSITMRADLQHLNSRLLASIGVVVGLIVALGFLAQLVSVRLHHSIAGPLLELLQTMEAVQKEKKYSLRVRKVNDDEFGALSEGFNRMLAEIEVRDAELAKHRNHLEMLVNRRTEELRLANKTLQAEIEERKQIQGQLERAQRMEAIGTLASGVAHDLNNILSGIVSYPELLLMSVKEDDKLYAPLKAIQNSGMKAAAIVQDLLTLARRGGKTFEVVSLATIVADYCNSPECNKVLENHPGVKITSEVDEDLLNVQGSVIHLSKTIMNLVLNGAEAIDGAGEITLRLRNVYLDQPVKGYDKIAEGNYVLLQVSDTGHGISGEDLKYIFEPFYSKKKMGTSGTGLGMTVVWGTVEDHKGYIDVASTLNRGTTFSLFFPATTAGLQIEKREQMHAFRGRGESILVVDDLVEQRVIASAILEELGYVVETEGSGEAAVELVQRKSFDLLVLDMIMEPGIDGIETFKRIQRIRPDQRAFVASGYADARRLDLAGRLGMAGYLKKPYTIAGLARTVREELDRN